MRKLVFSTLLVAITQFSHAKPPEARSLPLEQISIEHIDLQGQIRTWKLNKVCIDQQAYLLLMKGLTEPISISPSFKDGKPEQCRVAD
ncbi:hypothetical protein [Methylomonas fluvii]|uniref:Uncharacterized protein n=1 Tax=Methylomonas fluvii TaxID=1854564 RepID=A0ABR9DHF7_9GAMM|nr:hypothetical protein [Methylomonas fluvii]MBD9361659.1 hypothetical protein [Methylomonas fluvii]